MLYVKATNGAVDQFPYTVGNLRRDNPQTSFPKKVPEATLADYSVFPVTYPETPSYDPLTHCIKDDVQPTLLEGGWVLLRLVVLLTPQEVEVNADSAAKRVRVSRNVLLADSDWTQVADAPVNATSWATYRQALRDITDHVNFPYLADEDWPPKPD